MAFQNLTVDFRRLSKIPIRDRVALARSPQASEIFGNMTPSQIAALFPDYYKQVLSSSGAMSGSLAAGLTGAGTTGAGPGGGPSGSSTSSTATAAGAGTPPRPGLLQELLSGVSDPSAPKIGSDLPASQRHKAAVNFFTSKGYPRHIAIGLVANLMVESGNFSDDVISGKRRGDGGKAFGIAQWHPDRQALFQKAFGKSIEGSTFQEQLEFIDWELKNSEKAKAKLIFQTTTAAEAAAAIDEHYERSSGEHRSRRVNNAIELEKQDLSLPALPGTQPQTSTATTESDVNLENLVNNGAKPTAVVHEGEALNAQQRAEIRQQGGITVNLDTNAASENASIDPLIVIPDDATEQQRAAAQSYVDAIAASYNRKFGKQVKGKVTTTSENGRGRGNTIHTEAFNIRDKNAIQYYYFTEEGRKELAQITSSTLGTLPGVRFQLPHGADENNAASSGAVGPLGSEVDLANILKADLKSVLENQQTATAQTAPQTQNFDPNIFSQIDERYKELYDKANAADKKMIELAIMQKGVEQLNKIAANHPKASATAVSNDAIAGSGFDQTVSMDDDVMYGRKPFIGGNDFAVPIYTNAKGGKKFDENLEGLTPQAIERLKQQAIAAKAAGLTRLELYGAQTHEGHASHGAGTETDLVGYNADGSTWSRDQRATTALGAVQLGGANRAGFYGSGIGLHVGKADEVQGGPTIEAAWGPGGKTSGVSVGEFSSGLERDVAAYLKGQGPMPQSQALNAHLERMEKAKQQQQIEAASQTIATTPLPGTAPQTTEMTTTAAPTATETATPAPVTPAAPATSDVQITPLAGQAPPAPATPTANTTPNMKLGGEANLAEEPLSITGADGEKKLNFNPNEKVTIENNKATVKNEYTAKTEETQQKTDKGPMQNQQQENRFSVRSSSAPTTNPYAMQSKEGIVPVSPSFARQMRNASLGDKHFSRGSRNDYS